jgi:DNA-binding IclR family transcriptional regulator
MPMHLGAAPRAILAFEPEEAWERYLREATLAPGTSVAPHDPDALVAELRATRRRSYALSDEDVTPGIASVGAPIFDHRGEVAGSLSIGGVRQLILSPETDAAALIVDSAAEVSRALGFASNGLTPDALPDSVDNMSVEWTEALPET